MKSFNVHWRRPDNLVVSCIKVDAPNQIKAEDIAITMLLEKTRRFVIVAVEEDKPLPHAIPYGSHYWGGEFRNNAQWRKQW